MKLFTFFIMLLSTFVNGIAIRQYSDDACTQLSRIEYLKSNNCYTYSSSSSYLIKSCNCTIIEYDIYNGAICLGNVISNMYAEQNTCLSTRQKIACYEESFANNIIPNIFLILFITININNW